MPNKQYTQKLLNAILDNAYDGLLTVNEDGEIELYNKSCERLFHYSAAEAEKLLITDLMPDLGDIHKTMNKGCERSTRARSKDGKEFLVSVSLSDIPNGTARMKFISVRDLSAQKLAEQRLLQAEKMEAVGTITSTMVHNFNHLLSVMLGSLQTVKRHLNAPRPDLAQIEMHIDTVEAAAHKGGTQISRLMMFAYNQTDQDDNTLEALKPDEFIEDMSHLISMSLTSSINFTYSCEKNLPAFMIDRTRLESALLNMTNNAKDAMPGGGQFQIHIDQQYLDENYKTLSPEIRTGDYICFTISDTGAGMSQNTLDHLFEPFYTTKSKGKGTGLGMIVVYGCIHDAGGYVHVYSEQGRGTTFKLYIPVLGSAVLPTNPLANESANPAAPVAVSAETKQRIKSVLIIDDNPLMLDMIEQSFQRLGYAAQCAKNKDEIKSILNHTSTPFDLIFMDLIIDNQIQADSFVNLINETLNHEHKVIYASGYNLAYVQQHFDINDKVFIAKPFSRHDLREILKKF